MTAARTAVLVSGGGTNLQALIDAEARGELPHAKLCLVVSNVEGAFALTRAERAHIPTRVLNKRALGGQAAFEEALKALLKEYSIDLIVLAGFMVILSADFTRD